MHRTDVGFQCIKQGVLKKHLPNQLAENAAPGTSLTDPLLKIQVLSKPMCAPRAFGRSPSGPDLGPSRAILEQILPKSDPATGTPTQKTYPF